MFSFFLRFVFLRFFSLLFSLFSFRFFSFRFFSFLFVFFRFSVYRYPYLTAFVSGKITSVSCHILEILGQKRHFFAIYLTKKRNNFIKHCSPPCINKPPISEMCIYIRHNLYKWGLDTRGGGNNVLQPKNGGRVSLQHMKYVITNGKLHQSLTFW